MAKKESTTEALTRMLKEQEDRKPAERVTSEDGTVTINCPNNSGVVIGTHRGDFTF